MRISTKRLKRRRLKIIEARKQGATYIELQKRFGVSPSYLSKLFKGKDINKYCLMCGENDPKVLEKHHQDKENRPDYWIWLCSNCHSKVTRKQAKQRAKQKTDKDQIVIKQFPIPQKINNMPQVKINKSLPSSVQYKNWNKAEKIAFWATVIGGFTLKGTMDYVQKRREKQKYEKLRQDPEFQRKIQETVNKIRNPKNQKDIESIKQYQEIQEIAQKIDEIIAKTQSIIDKKDYEKQ